jgi:hypothetical protein
MIVLTLVHRSSSPGALLIWCLVGFCLGIGLFVYGFKLLLRRRLILDTPFSKIRSASMGMIEVSGQAVGPYTLVAPITERACYFYRTLVWEWKQQGRDKQWVKVAGECMHVPFFLDDNSGRMMIDPRGADLDLHRDFEQEFCDSFFTTKEPAPDSVRNFLLRHGVVTKNKIKVEEFCIKPKNALFILGTLAENPGIEVTAEPLNDSDTMNSFTPQGFSLSFSVSGGGGSFQTGSPVYQREMRHNPPAPQVIHVSREAGTAQSSNPADQQKVAAAMIKAGISNPAAWAAAGVAGQGAAAAVARSTPGSAGPNPSADTDFNQHPAVVLMKGENNKTFLISWRSQQEIARSLGWKCTLMIWGGPALALVCLYIFLGFEQLL